MSAQRIGRVAGVANVAFEFGHEASFVSTGSRIFERPLWLADSTECADLIAAAGVYRRSPARQDGYMHADRFDVTKRKLANDVGAIHARKERLPHARVCPAARCTIETIFDKSQQWDARESNACCRRNAASFVHFLAARGNWRIRTASWRFRTETTLGSERCITSPIDRAAPWSLSRRVLVRSLLTCFAYIQAARPHGPVQATNKQHEDRGNHVQVRYGRVTAALSYHRSVHVD